MPTVAQLRQAAGFAGRLYAGRARSEVAARVLRDPFHRLRTAPGRDDPYVVYEQIRARGGAVRTRLGNLAVVDHGECSRVLRGRRFGVQPEHEPPSDSDGMSFLNLNPPDHTRLRRLVAPAFSPRRIAGFEEMISRSVDGLLDDCPAEFDLVERLAAPLPIAVISQLLGIPDVDNEAFTRYGRVIGSALSGITSLRHARELMRADADLERLFSRLFEERRADPREDVISDLVAAEGARLEPREMVPICTLLLIAGFETTVNLVGNAVDVLLDHPDQWALLRDDPAAWAQAAVVETLRFEPPVQRTVRISFDDVELAGQPMRAGQFVHVLIGGANRDPAVFARPNVFDLTRSDAGEHLAFSSGIHHCVGRPLAELEARLLLQRLAERMPQLRRAGPMRRRNATLLRGPLRLPVATGA